MSAPGVGVLSLVLVAMPFQAYAATLGSGGPGTFGRPAEPFLAYITDHLGTVRAVVNSQGVVVETRDYDPFGGDIAHTGTFSVQHRFTGQPADDQAGGVYNYGARFYNPKWGRFLSPDEVTQGFDSQGLNPYAYVENGPTSAVDPDGHDLDFGSGAFSFGGFSSIGTTSFGASSGGGVGGAAFAVPGTLKIPNGSGTEIGFAPPPQTFLLIPLLLGLPEDAPLWLIPVVIGIAVGAGIGAVIVKSVPPNPPPPGARGQENTEDQDTVIQWAKEAKKKGGISKEDAEALKDLAKEAGVKPIRDHTDPKSASHFKDGPHLHIGSQDHIRVK